MLRCEEYIGRNRDLRRGKVDCCCNETGMRIDQEISDSLVEIGYNEFRVELICQVISLFLLVFKIMGINLKKIGS